MRICITGFGGGLDSGSPNSRLGAAPSRPAGPIPPTRSEDVEGPGPPTKKGDPVGSPSCVDFDDRLERRSRGEGHEEAESQEVERSRAVEETFEISERHDDTHLSVRTPGERGFCNLNDAKIAPI